MILTSLRLGLPLSVLFGLAACAPFPPGSDGTGAYANQTATGSNIARHNTGVQSVDGEAVRDVLRFGPGGACTRPVPGC